MNPLNRTATSPKRPAIWLLAAVLLAFVSFFLTTQSSAQEADAEAAETAPATEAADNESKSETETESPSTDTAEEQLGFSDKLNKQLDATLGTVNGYLFKVLFFDISFSAFDYITTDKETGESVEVEPEVPFLVIFLTLGAVFFTFWHKLINIRHFFHAWGIVSGKYTHESDEGDLSPFRALTSALSATVGLGNIASVAVAMVAGGPGALFWMMFLGLCGMCAKFHESTLAQMFRIKNEDGTISGGPMYYLDHGIRKVNPSLAPLGKTLAIIFAIFCMFAALGGGNMFQANQAFEGFFSTFIQPGIAEDEVDGVRTLSSIGFGLLMSAVVAVVVLGGITRIGATTSKIVPFMALVYVSACITIIAANASAVPAMIGEVLSQAFSADAAFGGVIGAMMMGFQRAAFSSESGLGSSAIAHSAAKTDHPVREGFVASLEPFIDTIVICFLTGMTVLITNAYREAEGGSAVTLYAFQQVDFLASWFPYILAVCIVLFAFSTMISWCYYGERAWGYLFGLKTVMIFRIVFVLFVFIGSVAGLGAVIDFSDAVLLSMAFPNIIGGIILAPMVKRKVQDYWARFRAGELDGSQPTNGED